MTTKEIRYTMKCLDLMCKDLNDRHNDYDIPTGYEDMAREILIEAITNFNISQSTWIATLKPCAKGWWIKYE